MVDAETRFHDRLAGIGLGADDSREDAQTGLNRKIEDSETDFHQRRIAIWGQFRDAEGNIDLRRVEDQEKNATLQAANQERYDQQTADARLDFARRVEDIATRAERNTRDSLAAHLAQLEEIQASSEESQKERGETYQAELLEIQDNANRDLAKLEEDHQSELLGIQNQGNADIEAAMITFGENVREGITTALDNTITDAQGRYNKMVADAQATARRIRAALNVQQPSSGAGLSFDTVPFQAPATQIPHVPEAIIPPSRLGEFGGGMTGDVTLYLDGFEEAVGRANLRQGRRGVE